MTPIKEQLLQEIEQTPEHLMKEILNFVQFVKAKQNELDCQESCDRPIWELFEEFTETLPEDTLAQLPRDGAEQHDHYIYGTPKRTQ